MKLYGFDSAESAALRMARQAGDGDDHVIRVADFPMRSSCAVSNVSVEFEGERHRPVVLVPLSLERLIAYEGLSLPYDIQEISFGDSVNNDGLLRYELSDDEIVQLVKKGLYLPGFDEFATQSMEYWDVPLRMDISIYEPRTNEEPPMVVVDMAGIDRIVFDKNYNETAYSTERFYVDVVDTLPDYAAYLRDNPEAAVEVEHASYGVDGNKYTDIFENEELPEYDQQVNRSAPVPTVSGLSVVDAVQRTTGEVVGKSVESLRDRQVAAEDKDTDTPAYVSDIERIYDERVRSRNAVESIEPTDFAADGSSLDVKDVDSFDDLDLDEIGEFEDFDLGGAGAASDESDGVQEPEGEFDDEQVEVDADAEDGFVDIFAEDNAEERNADTERTARKSAMRSIAERIDRQAHDADGDGIDDREQDKSGLDFEL